MKKRYYILEFQGQIKTANILINCKPNKKGAHIVHYFVKQTRYFF